jgi:hypothetical protein
LGDLLDLRVAGARKGERLLQLGHGLRAMIRIQVERMPFTARDFSQCQQVGSYERKAAFGLADMDARQFRDDDERRGLLERLGDRPRERTAAHLNDDLVDSLALFLQLVSIQKWWISVQAKAAAISQPQA